MREKTAVIGATVLSIGLFAGTASAASIIDLPQPGGNTVQVSAGQDVVQPQFSLWPFPNTANIETHGNTADGRGNNTTGQAWLFGTGAGNVVQFATGGNIFVPQVAAGTDNNLTVQTTGNTATNDGNSSSTTGGQPGRGTLIDGNGNVFQVAIFQGNVFAPQIAVGGDNHAVIDSQGNYVNGVGNGSDTSHGGGLTFLDGNGNVYQLVILSNNVIAPQVAVGGNNDVIVLTEGNEAYNAGNGSVMNVNGSNPVAGLFSVTTKHVGNGNVTQIAILSNNVWTPQIALPGHNTSQVTAVANDAQADGNESETTLDSVPPPPRKRPILHLLGLDGDNQVGNGTVQQTGSDSGNITNDQLAFKPKVKTSFKAEPAADAGDKDATPKKAWKPGDGIKRIIKAVTGKPDPSPAPEQAA